MRVVAPRYADFAQAEQRARVKSVNGLVVNRFVSDTRVIAGSLAALWPTPYFDSAVIDVPCIVTNRAFL